jgi:hypothetical protein
MLSVVAVKGCVVCDDGSIAVVVVNVVVIMVND